jgi:hypothetical protein
MTAPTDTTGLLVAAGLIVIMAAVIFVFATCVFALFFRAVPESPVADEAQNDYALFGYAVEPDPLWHPEPAHTVWDGEEAES